MPSRQRKASQDFCFSQDLRSTPDLLEAVTAIVSRHPVQQRELQKAIAGCFSDGADRSEQVMQQMLATGRFALVEHNGEPYWVIKENAGS